MKSNYTRSLYYMEDPDPIVGVQCSTGAVAYNPASSYTVPFTVWISEGNEQKAPDAVGYVFLRTDHGTVAWANNAEFEGVTLHHSLGAAAANFSLDITTDSVAEGVLTVIVSYHGKNHLVELPVVRVVNGVQGPRGIKGPYIRGPRDWDEVRDKYGTSSTEHFYSGTDEEPFLDLVLKNGIIFRCKTTHLVSLSRNPSSLQGMMQWEELSQVEYVATRLLLAERAKIRNLIAEGIEMRSDDDSRVVFAVYRKDNGDAVVYANQGTFENVSVRGDIRSNTQTFTTPEFPSADIRMWETSYGGRSPSDVIPIEPQGGCIIAPTGKCNYQILLPSIPENTARQLIIVNQKMPYTKASGEGSRKERKVYLTPGANYVRLFPSMDSEESSAKLPTGVGNQQEPQSIELGYGAFMAFAYTAQEPGVGSLLRTYTYWSVWQMSQGEATINFNPRPFTPKEDSRTTLHMYYDNPVPPNPFD